MIFEGEKGKTIEKIHNLYEIKQKKLIVKCQSEVWCDKKIFTSWIDEVFSPYLLFESKKPGLLILDKSLYLIKINYSLKWKRQKVYLNLFLLV